MTGPHGTTVPVIGKGSRFGAPLKTGTFQLVQAYRRKPGVMPVRLRLHARTLGEARTAFVSSRSIRGGGGAG